MKIILATWNITKFKWLSEGFSKTNLPIAPVNKEQIEDVEETGKTCEQNALIKVRAIGKIHNSIIIGEDSGLFIDALNGFPGVRTVRWMEGTDDDRSKKIIEMMAHIPKADRSARFTSAVAILFPNGTEKIFTGNLEGSVPLQLLGNSGQGYQRIFILNNGKTLAESGSAIIRKHDHRSQAIEKTCNFIKNYI